MDPTFKGITTGQTVPVSDILKEKKWTRLLRGLRPRASSRSPSPFLIEEMDPTFKGITTSISANLLSNSKSAKKWTRLLRGLRLV